MGSCSLTNEEIDAEITRLANREGNIRHIIKEMQRDADALEIRQMNLKRVKYDRDSTRTN